MFTDIVNVRCLGGHRLHVTFDDNVKGELDFDSFLDYAGVLAPLRDPAFFAQVRINEETGSIEWPGGIDLDAYVLREMVLFSPSSAIDGQMSSPVSVLTPFIKRSIESVAPEKRHNLKSLIDGSRPRFESDYVGREFPYADPSSHTVYFPVWAMEILWQYAYCTFCIYNEGQSLQFRFDNLQRQRINSPRLDNALTWLSQAANSQLHGMERPWPPDMPQPIQGQGQAPDADVATELFLVSCGFILLHEIAHIHYNLGRGGSSGKSAIEQEWEADSFALNWMLDELGISEEGKGKRDKRGLGVTLGLLVLCINGILTGKHRKKTHPAAFERLMNGLGKIGPDPNHLGWAFAEVFLRLFMSNIPRFDGKLSPPSGFETIQDAVRFYTGLLDEESSILGGFEQASASAPA